MLSFGNKEFKNLQEQVLQNSNAIEALTQGLKIIGVGPIIPASLKDGEAYLVGTAAPYDLKIKINGNIVDLGQFPKEGPKGDQGPAGPISKLNSISTTTKTIDSGMNASVTAELDHNKYNAMFTFEIPMGEQGPVGPRGPQGPEGQVGPEGPVGPRGEVSYGVKILATIANTSLLPDPKSVDRNAGYLVGTTAPYSLYILIGEDVLTWFKLGTFSIIIDDKLSTSSTNAIQNRVVSAAFDELKIQVNNNEQDIGAINSCLVKDYTNLDSDATINKGLTVSTNGDTTVGRHLTINGKTKLNSGLAPIHTYSFHTQVLDIYWENFENAISGVSTYSYIGVIHGFIGKNSQDVFGTYKIEGTTLKLVSVFYYDENGLQQTIWNLPNGGMETHVYITDGKLDTIGQKQVDGSVIYNDSLTVDANGDVNVPENLLVQGTAKLAGGFEPVETLSFETNEGTYTFSIYTQIVITSSDTSKFVNFFGKLDEPDEPLSVLVTGSYYRDEQENIIDLNAIYFDMGTHAIILHIYLDGGHYKSETSSILTTSANLQSQLFRHVIKLTSTTPALNNFIVYESQFNLKIDRPQDLTAVLKPDPGFYYPLSSSLETFNTIIYQNESWMFSADGSSTGPFITSVSDSVTAM